MDIYYKKYLDQFDFQSNVLLKVGMQIGIYSDTPINAEKNVFIINQCRNEREQN